MIDPHTAPAATLARDPWRRRARRAAALRARLPFAAAPLALYERLLQVQAPAHARALADRPPVERIAAYVVRRTAPAVVEATVAGGTAVLAAAASSWLGARAERDVERWLAGEPLEAIPSFFARASAAPVLEALADGEALAHAPATDARHCPRCGGLPQVAFTGNAGEALVTAPLRLCCARCGGTWPGPRLCCAACGETDTARLCSFAADEPLPHLRADACRSCRSYLVHVDLRRDPDAVPEVDELAALPLDLHAQQQGFGKLVINLMGIG